MKAMCMLQACHAPYTSHVGDISMYNNHKDMGNMLITAHIVHHPVSVVAVAPKREMGSPVIDDSEEAKGEANAEGHGHSVLGIRGHALEDLPCTNDGRHNGRQTRAGQHNVSSATGSISCTCHTVSCSALAFLWGWHSRAMPTEVGRNLTCYVYKHQPHVCTC